MTCFEYKKHSGGARSRQDVNKFYKHIDVPSSPVEVTIMFEMAKIDVSESDLGFINGDNDESHVSMHTNKQNQQ